MEATKFSPEELTTAKSRLLGLQSEPNKCSCGKDVAVQKDDEGQVIGYFPSCSACAEKAAERQRRRDEETRQYQERLKQEARKTRVVRQLEENIPPLFEGACMDDLPKALSEKLLGLPFERGIYLWGPVGSGKSHTACAWLKHCISKDLSCKRVKWDRLCLQIRDTYSSNRSESNVIEPYVSCDILVLEDLGTSVDIGSTETPFAIRTLLLLIDERMEHCRPTFITSNKTIEEIEHSFDQRTASRIKGTCEIVKLDGKDRRERKIRRDSNGP